MLRTAMRRLGQAQVTRASRWSSIRCAFDVTDERLQPGKLLGQRKKNKRRPPPKQHLESVGGSGASNSNDKRDDEFDVKWKTMNNTEKKQVFSNVKDLLEWQDGGRHEAKSRAATQEEHEAFDEYSFGRMQQLKKIGEFHALRLRLRDEAIMALPLPKLRLRALQHQEVPGLVPKHVPIPMHPKIVLKKNDPRAYLHRGPNEGKKKEGSKKSQLIESEI